MTEKRTETKSDLSVINAHPTKELFIDMLVKDIPLIRAVIDLIDNAVDGAKRLMGEGPYTGLWIRATINENSFTVIDNCGGIPVDVARDYAFRFGRPENMELTKRSIGQFGVGMKRAFFKIGNKFEISSISESSRFSMKVDVNRWKSDRDKWEFKFADFEENQNNSSEDFLTDIRVTDIHKDIKNDFKRDIFIRRLVNDLQEAHIESLGRGLVITINQIPLRIDPLVLYSSAKLKPAFREDEYRIGPKKESVTVKIFTGLGESSPKDAGWYIFCNGRLILSANQTNITGWGEDYEITIPKYHNQFARFRGYVFFDADNAGLLPWNTTKTGVDSDSALYKAVRQNMLTMMRTVIVFLNKLKDERDANLEDETGPIQSAISETSPTKITDIKTSGLAKTFKPKIQASRTPPPPKFSNITYSKLKDEVEWAKRKLKAKSYKEVGEKTFEYFLEMERIDEN